MSESPAKPAEKSADETLLEEARKRFKLCEEAERENRAEAIDDLEFLAGNQWPEDVKRQRDEDGRPCHTVNILPSHVKQVENDIRQNRPSIKVRAVDDKADVETAKVKQGLFRHIERDSNADVAYDRAIGGAVRCGIGFLRVGTDYCDPKSFDQEIKIWSVPNPLTCSLDPASKEPDGSDAEFGFASDYESVESLKAQYPNAKLVNKEEFADQLGAEAPDWMRDDGHLRVCEYFFKEWKKDTLYLLSDGSKVLKSELPAGQSLPPEIVKGERETIVPHVKWVKMTGAEILERRDWPGKYIPIIPVYGEEIWVNGKRKLKSLIRDAKDSQRMRNYWKSAETEAIALAPRAPYVGYAGSFKGYEQKWALANKKSFPYLEVAPFTIGGQPAPLPQRQTAEPAIQAITMAAREANEDIKMTTGIYDASLGNRSNETSGVAIARRANQAQTSNFHFIDNGNRSIRHVGRVCLDLMPHVYDAARVIRIIGENDEEKIVAINQELEGEKTHKMDAGRYDVSIDTGPSFQTQRQEAAETMLELMTKVPMVSQAAPDLVVKNMDFPGNTEVADRLKKLLDPKLTDDGKKSPIPPQLQAQLEQMGKMIEKLTAELNEAKNPLELKRMELESKERIELQKIQAEAEIEMAKLGSKEAVVMLQAELAQIESRMNLLNQMVPVGEESPRHEMQEAPQQEQVEHMAPAQGFQTAVPEGAGPQEGYGSSPDMEVPQ